MARITVEDCISQVNNRFELVLLATKRARQIARGATPLLEEEENDKPTVLALREIAEGHVTNDFMKAEELAVIDREREAEEASFPIPGQET